MVGHHIEYKLQIPHPTAVFLLYLDLFIDKFTSDQVFHLFPVIPREKYVDAIRG